MATYNVGQLGDDFAKAASAWDNYDKTNLPPTNISEISNLVALASTAVGMFKNQGVLGIGYQANFLALMAATANMIAQIAKGEYQAAASSAAGVVANIATLISYGYPPAIIPARITVVTYTALSLVLDPSTNLAINDSVSDFLNAAQKWIELRDPLTLDLDGDGIETVAPSSTNPILFDHDGDGIKNGTGWIKSDDGLLVLDRNGNGVIDNGSELFGDSTNLISGGKAADGFAALVDQDSNKDGKVNALDTNWNQLKVWRDLNQDGISQAAELSTLSQLGINGLNTGKTANSQILADGNEIADLGTYTKTDGTVATLGEVSHMADVNLASDTFHREFPDQIPLAAGVANLPDMQGSDKVRNHRQSINIAYVKLAA